MRNIALNFMFLFFTSFLFSQDYGLLFLTNMNNSNNSGLLRLDLNPNNSGYQNIFDYSMPMNSGQSFGNFELLDNGWNNVNIIINSYSNDNFGGCNKNQTFTYTPEEFNQTILANHISCVGSIAILPLRLSPPSIEEKLICSSDYISLNLGWNYQYRIIKKDFNVLEWTDFSENYQNLRSITFNLNQILTEDEILDISQIQFRTGYQEKFTSHITYDIIDCSISHTDLKTADISCYSESNGEVTLTFDKNVESGYQMRYFIFQGDPSEFGGSYTNDTMPNETFSEFLFDTEGEGALQLNPDGTYSGSFQGLEGSESGTDYYIIYQEVQYGQNDDVQVKSGNITEKFTIYQPSAVTFTSSPQDPNCTGDPGSIALVASGGKDRGLLSQGAYQFSIDEGSNWLNADGNGELVVEAFPREMAYTILCRLVNADNFMICEGSGVSEDEEMVFINNPTNPLAIHPNSGVTTHPSIGQNDGGLYIQITGGTAPYVYNLYDNSNPSVSINTNTSSALNTTFSNLGEGDYFVEVVGKSCTVQSEVFSLTTYNIPSISDVETSPISCLGTDDATFLANITYDTSTTLSYRLLNSFDTVVDDGYQTSTTQLAVSINNLSAGTYRLQAISEYGNFSNVNTVVEETITIVEPEAIELISLTGLSANCNGASDAGILVETGNDTMEYEYTFRSGFEWLVLPEDFIIPVENSNFYYIKIRKRGETSIYCESDEVSVYVPEPLRLSLLDSTDVSVRGGNDGSIQIAVEEGNGEVDNFTFEWTLDGNSFTISANSTPTNLQDLESGTYGITVTDSQGCSQSLFIVINEPEELSISTMIANDVSCFAGSDGSIEVIVTGTAPYTYAWVGPNYNTTTANVANNQITVTNLLAGEYILTVSDNSTADAVSLSVTINQPLSVLNAQTTITNANCFGFNNGSISVEASGGTAPYEYSINNTSFQNTGSFENLEAATYSITVRDANLCEFIISDIQVNQPEALVISLLERSDVSETGATDGSISVEAQGGSSPSNYSYLWTSDNPNFSATTQQIQNLAPGTYYLVVRDENITDMDVDCSVAQSFTIGEPGELLVDISQSLFLNCNGDSDAELTVAVSGGVSPYRYEWYQSINNQDILLEESSSALSFLSAGTYGVRVIDANNVSRNSPSFVISEPDNLTIIEENVQSVLCFGEFTGEIDISIQGGTAPYFVEWSNQETTEDLTNLATGEYSVTVEDINGCVQSRTFTVGTVLEPLEISDEVIINGSGYKTNDGSITLVISGGTAPYMLEWTKAEESAYYENGLEINNLEAGMYSVVVTDANNCSITASYRITEPDIVEETIVPPSCQDSCDASLSILVNQGDGNFTYVWSTGETSNSIQNLCPGIYKVQVNGFEDEPLVRSYTIENPLPIEVNLGEDQILCLGQQATLNAEIVDPNAQYVWTSDNGFSSNDSQVTVSETGTYHVQVTSSLGCTGEDSIYIEVSTDEISAQFATSSQLFMGETFVMVDISYPLPDNVEWILPDEATVISSNNDEVELQFNEAGEYEVGLQTTRGNCTAIDMKKVLILERERDYIGEELQDSQKRIDDFIVYPNPTSGMFSAEVQMSEAGAISIKVYSFSNNLLLAEEKREGSTQYSIPMDISGATPGVYAVYLETPHGSAVRKVIINP